MNYYNEERNVTVIINGNNTGIMGDPDKVTDEEIFELWKGNILEGWVRKS